MEGKKELKSKKFQKLLTEIGHELQPHDVEHLKYLLKEKLTPSLLDDIDVSERKSGFDLLKKLQQEGRLAEDNLELLKELFSAIGRHDLLEKVSNFEREVKDLGKPPSKAATLPATRGTGLSVVDQATTGLSAGQGSTGKNPPPDETRVLDAKRVKVDSKGGFHDLSSFGVLLQFPPNAVNRSAKFICVKFSPDSRSPTEENETLVSYCVRIYSTSVHRLEKPIIVTLLHSGPSKKEGYETVVKAWAEPKEENQWKQIEERREESPLARERFQSGFVEVEISDWTALAVVTRPITDTFEVTDKGCVVKSSLSEDVTVEFPEGAVDKTYKGSMKLLMMPDHIDILEGIAAYPCPMLLIDGFEGVAFNVPVKIKLPHPYPAGYPSGNVRLLTMDDPHEWKDITDQVKCVESESFIELQVSHFSWSWAWLCAVSSVIVVPVAVSLSKYQFKAPQSVFFAVFKKENEEYSDTSLTMTLVCVPNHEQFKKTKAMEEQGYKQLASSTGNKKMRPEDKAYTKVEGCYKKKLQEDIYLQFIENDICRKELPLLRTTHEEGTSVDSNTGRELIMSLLEKKGGDANDTLCTFCIDETKIVPKTTQEPSTESETIQKGGTVVGLECAPGSSGLCSSGTTVNRFSRSTSDSKAAACRDLEVCFGDKSIATIDANEAASKVRDLLKLDMDKLSLEDPPDEIMVKCRDLCSCLKSNKRDDIVKKVRDLLPSGMTGPLVDGSILVKNMDYNLKKTLSQALSGKDEWEAFAEKIGVSKDDIGYYDRREKNPVLAILDKRCGNMTVEELYVHIVESGANAIADKYL